MAAPYVFISYRRRDAEVAVFRLFDHVSRALGRGRVFADTESIVPGEAFPDRISAAIARATVVLVIIGPNWTTATDEHGRRRLLQDDDFVRREIREALASRAMVVPVVVDGAALPLKHELPADIAELADRQATTLRRHTWDADLAALTAVIRPHRAIATLPPIAAGAWIGSALGAQAAASLAAASASGSTDLNLAPVASGLLLYGGVAAGVAVAVRQCYGVFAESPAATAALVGGAAAVARLITGGLGAPVASFVAPFVLWSGMTLAVVVGHRAFRRANIGRTAAIVLAAGAGAAAGTWLAQVVAAQIPSESNLAPLRTVLGPTPLRWCLLSLGIIGFVGNVPLMARIGLPLSVFAAAVVAGGLGDAATQAVSRDPRVLSNLGVTSALLFGMIGPVAMYWVMRIVDAQNARPRVSDAGAMAQPRAEEIPGAPT